MTDDNKKIGFGDGFWLFQKTVDGDAGYHRGKGVELGEILQALTAKLDIFAEELDFTREAIKGKQEYAGLLNVMNRLPNKTWGHLSVSAEFADWLITQLPQKYAHIHRNLVFDLLAERRLETWGPF